MLNEDCEKCDGDDAPAEDSKEEAPQEDAK